MLEPKAAGWLAIGLLLVALSLGVPHIVHLTGSFSADRLDALRGFVAGIGVGIEFVVLIKFRRRRRTQEGPSI